MAVSQHFVAYLCKPNLIPEYLLLCLKAMVQELEARSSGSTIPTIGMTDICSLRCPLPPTPEQTRIVEHVKSESAKLAMIGIEIQQAIERLREYRGALITTAVTGKIDVRDEAKAAA